MQVFRLARHRSASLPSFFFLIIVTTVLSGCQRTVGGVEPEDVRLATIRWVDVEPGGNKSGIEVHSSTLVPSTGVGFVLPSDGFVLLAIYNGVDVPVAVLISNMRLAAGAQEVSFSATDLPSGVYVYHLTVHGVTPQGKESNEFYTTSRKMLLLK